MEQDWDAVAKAISDRIAELGMRQRDLADRADVGLSTVQELANNWKPRKRNPKTLKALSRALGWHPGQIEAIAAGTAAAELNSRFGSSSSSLVEALAEALRRAGVDTEQYRREHPGADLILTMSDQGDENWQISFQVKPPATTLEGLAERVEAVEHRLDDLESVVDSRHSG